MSPADLIPLLPIIAPAAAAVAILFIIGSGRNHALAATLSLAGLAAGFVPLCGMSAIASTRVASLLTLDGYALFFAGLILAASFVVVLLSHGYLQRRERQPEEFYVLLLIATAGAVVLAASSHFVSFFLGLEALTVSLYTLIAYERQGRNGIEAGVKYLILAAVSAAFLLFGMALIYAEFGTMEFSRIAEAWSAHGHSLLAPAGLAMIIVGVGFKLALAPFHMWTPDVYQGAPAPATAFLATVSKTAVFAVLLRYFAATGAAEGGSLRIVLTLTAILSMFTGNLLALMQASVKRILAYSSIAHSGYLLIALLAARAYAPLAASYYLLAYVVTTLGTWGVVAALSNKDGDADSLEDYRGLAWRRPWLSGALTAMLFSLAGIPLTAGFVGKYYLLTAGVAGGMWLLVIMLVVNSAIGLYYYVRIIVAMYSQPSPAAAESPAATRTSPAASFALAGLLFFLVWFGVYPGPLIGLLQTLAGNLH
ncbi:MAG: NADH-quinone oxidoreductase subunit N [Candidatus Brocadiia bacterium]